ncbi:hypothetical protein RJ639_026905 [Escallonia herrerae]|uniref:Uncharacterized protein n=1 Tax=Escallonia herrerae TaxID=1293975 RepID=A0AA88XD66_9ASTE|nr:hypothetical protein RJ639_026905 [Escallonia herrerae]
MENAISVNAYYSLSRIQSMLIDQLKLLKRKLNPKPSVPSNHARSGSDSAGELLDHNRYFLQLEGEEELPKGVVDGILRNVGQFIQKAEQK